MMVQKPPQYDQMLKKNEQMYTLLANCLSLCPQTKLVEENVNTRVKEKFAERGLRSLAVARQEVPEKNKGSPGEPWQFVCRALILGVNVKMVAGDQLAIAKVTGRRLMSLNKYRDKVLAFMFPGIVFAIFFVLCTLILGEKSSGTVSFGAVFALMFLWFGISVPLVFVGSYLSFKNSVVSCSVTH